jgi:hypothetical protein
MAAHAGGRGGNQVGMHADKIFGQANASYATGHPLSKDAKFFQNGPSKRLDSSGTRGSRRPRRR